MSTLKSDAELIRDARKAVDTFRDHARLTGMDFRQRDPLVSAIHRALDLADEAAQRLAAAALAPGLSSAWTNDADACYTVADGEPVETVPARTIHPAVSVREDDGEAVTEEWLKAVGWKHELGSGVYAHPSLLFEEGSIHSYEHTSAEISLPECKTRGDVRRLCSALGIELRKPQ